MPHPVVARVHGAVAGFGLSLMNACDLVVAADDTYFASAYRNIALTPDGGGSWSLPRLVGLRRATEILLLGERFDARQALACGLVNRVVPQRRTRRRRRRGRAVCLPGPRARAFATPSACCGESLANTLSTQLDAEAVSFGACAATADFVEGIGAFLEKRPARFARHDDTP